MTLPEVGWSRHDGDKKWYRRYRRSGGGLPIWVPMTLPERQSLEAHPELEISGITPYSSALSLGDCFDPEDEALVRLGCGDGFAMFRTRGIAGSFQAFVGAVEEHDDFMDLSDIAVDNTLRIGVTRIPRPQPDKRLASLQFIGTTKYTVDIKAFAQRIGIGFYWLPIPWGGNEEVFDTHNDGARRWLGAWTITKMRL